MRLSLALLVVAACKPLDDHPDPTTHDEYIAANLTLDENALTLVDLAECADLQPFDVMRRGGTDVIETLPFAVRALPARDGTLVQTAVQCGSAVVDRYLYVPASGTPVALSRPFGAPEYTTLPDPRSVPIPGGTLVVDCSGSAFGAVFDGTQLRAVDATAFCAAIPAGYDWGLGAAVDGGVWLAHLGGGLVFEHFDGDLLPSGEPVTTAGPLDESKVVFAAELPDGRLSAVVLDPTRSDLDAWVDGDGPFAIAAWESAQDRHPAMVAPKGDGTWNVALEPDDGGGGELWNYVPGGGGGARIALAELPTTDLPDVDGAHVGFGAAVTVWHDVSLDDHQLDSPITIAAHALRRDGTYATPDVPSTPCDERYRCRKVGDPYVLALAPTDGGGVAIYGLWDWFGYGGVYAIAVSDFE